MSLAVAIESTDGIVLAADSRATFGDPRGMTGANDTVKKVFAVTTRSGIAMVGAAETGASLIETVVARLQAAGGQPDVNTVAETVRLTANELYQKWFGQLTYIPTGVGLSPTPRPDVIFLLAGYADGQGGQARIITMISSPPFNFAPNMSTTGFAAVGIVPLAVYLLNRLYQRGINLDIAKDLAAHCILETASQDGKVGGPLSMAIIKPDNDLVVLNAGQIDEVIERVNRHRESLKNSFLQLSRGGQAGS
jgi:20S proteasome alpha/beta subunit